MKAASRSAVLSCLCVLAACGAEDSAPSEPPPVEETVFGEMVGTMEKARGVEAILQQDKAALDRAVEAAESEP